MVDLCSLFLGQNGCVPPSVEKLRGFLGPWDWEDGVLCRGSFTIRSSTAVAWHRLPAPALTLGLWEALGGGGGNGAITQPHAWPCSEQMRARGSVQCCCPVYSSLLFVTSFPSLPSEIGLWAPGGWSSSPVPCSPEGS